MAGEGDDRGWDGWMASRTRWTWVWVNSGRWWWTGRPGVMWFMGSQRIGHNWATELNWTELHPYWRLHHHVEIFLFRACSYSKHSACGVGRQAYSFCTATHQAACPRLLACYLSKNLTTPLRQYSGVEIGEWPWTLKNKSVQASHTVIDNLPTAGLWIIS